MTLTAISESFRAERIWAKIQRKPVSLVFTKPKVTLKTGPGTETVLAAQTVRISYNNPVALVEGEAGTAPKMGAIVYGVKGHPSEDVPDTDIDEGYTFAHEGNTFRVSDVIPVPGGLQAVCIAIG